MIYLLLLLFVAISLLVTYKIISNKILNTPPLNNPKDYIKNNKGKNKSNIMMTIGDSITHGVGSHNYSKIIELEFEKHGYETINAGFNADLAYSVAQRIEDIVECQPKIVTILIGTNDVISTFGGRNKGYWKIKRIPKGQETSLGFYLDNLEIIVKKLKAIPDVKIYLYSLPVLGEDLLSVYNQKVKVYSESIKAFSEKESLNYLPLNESMRSYLESSPSVDGLEFGKEQFACILAIILNRYFGYSWNEISTRNNLQLTTETIHLNEKGAQMVSDLAIEKIIPTLE